MRWVACLISSEQLGVVQRENEQLKVFQFFTSEQLFMVLGENEQVFWFIGSEQLSVVKREN